MYNELMASKPRLKETLSSEKEGVTASSHETGWQTPIEFSGKFEKDYKAAWNWYGQYNLTLVSTTSANRQEYYDRVLDHLEKQPWQHRFTTSEGSRYFVSSSGVVIRFKGGGTTEPWPRGGRLKSPTRLIGFVPEELVGEFVEFVKVVNQGHNCNNRLVSTAVAGEKNDQYAPTMVTFKNLSPQPQVGLHPLDALSRGKMEQIEFDCDHRKVSFAYDSRCHPNAHIGHAITEVQSLPTHQSRNSPGQSHHQSRNLSQ